MEQTPLFLLTGFLGSGKTTLLNFLLSRYRGKKIGIILNEFGDLNIDIHMIPQDDSIRVTELNGGQIFCSCLSGSFIDAVTSFKNLDLEVILVETSGLSKPAPLRQIIKFAYEKGEYFFKYKGMICVIDAERFEILDEALMTLGEQISYSDKILINKIDLVNKKTVERIKKKVKALNPIATIASGSYGRIPPRFLAVEDNAPVITPPEQRHRWSGWGNAGRPVSVTFLPKTLACMPGIKNFVEQIAKDTFRMKGFLRSENNTWIKIDCTGSNVRIEELKRKPAANIDAGLVILVPGDSLLPEMLKALWEDGTGEKEVIRL